MQRGNKQRGFGLQSQVAVAYHLLFQSQKSIVLVEVHSPGAQGRARAAAFQSFQLSIQQRYFEHMPVLGMHTLWVTYVEYGWLMLS